MMRLTAPLPLVLAGCVDVVVPVADPGLTLDPVQFFAGRSAGAGSLKTIFGTSSIDVQSLGRSDGKRGLVLTQVIREEGKKPRQRIWTLKPAGAGRFTGELTDARGPVSVDVVRGSAIIGYTMKNGMQVNQVLALRQGGRTLRNGLTVYKFGIPVARVDEVIRKLD